MSGGRAGISLTRHLVGRARRLSGVTLLPKRVFALMKSMNIAASSELIPRLSTHRNVVALDSTDFTDVAAVVITPADSRSGILALLKRTGFHLPVFMLADEPVSAPVGVTAVIGRERCRGWWSWKTLYCRYEAELLPPFLWHPD